MKKLVLFILATASISAFGVGGTVDAEWANGCNLSDGSYCYNSSGIYPSGTNICSTFNSPPGQCSMGLVSGSVDKNKKVLKAAPAKRLR